VANTKKRSCLNQYETASRHGSSLKCSKAYLV
jgi:hypothetical protein